MGKAGHFSTENKDFDPAKDLLDLTGKVVIVTGGNTGIGRDTIKHLVRCGAKVYMAARNESKATGAIAALEKEGLGDKGGKVIWHKLDLSDPRDVKKSAEEFLAREERLDILVNNAAMIWPPYVKTHDGIVDSMMINHIGPFVFTMTLLPLMKSTAAKGPNPDVRIVFVASGAHRFVPSTVHYKTVDDFNASYSTSLVPPFMRYGHSKLPNILFARELQRRLNEEGSPIVVIALHPGAVNSFSDRIPLPRAIIDPILHLFFLRVHQGAFTSAFAAASPKVKEDPESYKGKYLLPFGKLEEPSTTAQDPDLATELWATTEKVLSDIGISV